LLTEDPAIPISAVIGKELTIHGSHGMPASAYPELLDLVGTGTLRPQDVITQRIGLDDVPEAMARMARGDLAGVTVIDIG
jgi:alcohol dehydrogenase